MANENGWGDGVLNNDIGWGQGSGNEIGWGSIYALSESGLTALESAQIDFSFGNALSFDGINDSVTFSPITKAALISGLCFGFWVRFTSTPNFEYILGDSNNINNWFRWNNTTSATFRSRATASGTTTFTFPAISINTWHYIALSINSGVNELWINSVKYTGNTNDYAGDTITFNLLGLSSTSYGAFIIDELFIKVASTLTNQNVLDLYNGGNGQYATDVIDSVDVYYRFNEYGSATVAADSSGNGNDGTLNNFTTPPDYWVAH